MRMSMELEIGHCQHMRSPLVSFSNGFSLVPSPYQPPPKVTITLIFIPLPLLRLLPLDIYAYFRTFVNGIEGTKVLPP